MDYLNEGETSMLGVSKQKNREKINASPFPINNLHRYLSIAIYLICLIPDALYTGTTYKAVQSISLLLMGLLGVFAGYFSWLANPFYFIALISKKRKLLSYSTSFIAFLLALSFLVKEDLVGSAAGTHESIVAYGPGYFLWVLAIGILLLGEILIECNTSNKTKLISLSGAIVVMCAFYGGYYFYGENSIYYVFSERGKKFDELCSQVKEEQYKHVNDMKGVFIDNIPGDYFQNISGQKYGAYGSDLISYINKGYYEFEERRPYSQKKTNPPYVRVYSDNPKKYVPVSNLESNYSVTAIDLASDLPKALGIKSYKVLIKSLASNEIYAETSFVSIKNERKICAPTKTDSYSVSNFVFRALDLNKDKYFENSKTNKG